MNIQVQKVEISNIGTNECVNALKMNGYLKKKSNVTTVPIVFYYDKYIGGSDDFIHHISS